MLEWTNISLNRAGKVQRHIHIAKFHGKNAPFVIFFSYSIILGDAHSDWQISISKMCVSDLFCSAFTFDRIVNTIFFRQLMVGPFFYIFTIRQITFHSMNKSPFQILVCSRSSTAIRKHKVYYIVDCCRFFARFFFGFGMNASGKCALILACV